MDEDASLVDLLADLLGELTDTKAFGQRTLDLVAQIEGGRAAALIKVRDSALSLFVSHAVDQEALQAAEAIWRGMKEALEAGEIFSTANHRTEPRLRDVQLAAGATAIVVAPVFEGELLVGLFYIDSPDPAFVQRMTAERLRKVARMYSRALSDDPGDHVSLANYLERTPLETFEREKLLLLLARHRWNVAEVARLMGTTRATIYERLERFKIQRQKAPRPRGKRLSLAWRPAR